MTKLEKPDTNTYMIQYTGMPVFDASSNIHPYHHSRIVRYEEPNYPTKTMELQLDQFDANVLIKNQKALCIHSIQAVWLKILVPTKNRSPR